jgi:hypothetical protein
MPGSRGGYTKRTKIFQLGWMKRYMQQRGVNCSRMRSSSLLLERRQHKSLRRPGYGLRFLAAVILQVRPHLSDVYMYS